MDILGWDYQRLAQVKWVAGAVNFSVRTEKLSWSHHERVSRLDPAEQRYWLDRAVAEGLSPGTFKSCCVTTFCPGRKRKSNALTHLRTDVLASKDIGGACDMLDTVDVVFQ